MSVEFSLWKESGTVLISSEKAVNGFDIGFDVETELIFSVEFPKDLNMTGLMDYQWKFNSNLLKIVAM